MIVHRDFIFTWMVENFKMLPKKCGECIKSPVFTMEQFLKSRWYLKLYPRGNNSNSVDYISCYLSRSIENDPQEIRIVFQVTINGVTTADVHCFNDKSLSWGWSKFMPRKSVEHLQDCVVECHIRVFFSEAVGITDQSVVSYFANLPEKLSEFGKKWPLVPGDAVSGSGWSAPQSFARTLIAVEKRIITFPIKNCSLAAVESKQVIPVTTPSATLFLTLLYGTKANDNFLEIEIGLKSKIKSNWMLICKVELVDIAKTIFRTFEGDHLFEGGKGENWNLHPLTWSDDVEGLKTPSLRFTLAFSNGQCFSDIEWTTGMDDSDDASHFARDLANDLHRMYSEKKFCDVSIRTIDGSFDVHKVILCLGSPVFAAMFESGLKENDSSVIDIQDLDSTTVSRMIAFMYTGNTGEMDAENAMKLYFAADKYQIMTLKNNCRSILKNNLSMENICAVLSLADAHLDTELMKSAITFASCSKKDILKSKNWKELKENNIHLALDTLTKMCMK